MVASETGELGAAQRSVPADQQQGHVAYPSNGGGVDRQQDLEESLGSERVGLILIGAQAAADRLESDSDPGMFGGDIEFLEASTRAGAVRTLEALACIEAGAEGGALIECVTTTRTAKNGTTTTTVRERFTPPDWRADGWFLERRHPADWSRRTELVLPDHEQAAEADPLVGVHDELRLARLARQKQQGKSV